MDYQFNSIFKAIGDFFSWIFGGSGTKDGAFDYKVSKSLVMWFGKQLDKATDLPLTTTIDMSECLSIEELKKLNTAMLTNFLPLVQTFPSKEEVTEIEELVKNLFDQSIWEEFKTKSKDIKKLSEFSEAKVTLRGLKLQMLYFMFYKQILIFNKKETNKILTKIKLGVLEEIKKQGKK